MESIDNLITASKSLYDHRVSEQRNEIESLRKEILKLKEESKVKLSIEFDIMDEGTQDEKVIYKIVAKWNTGIHEYVFWDGFNHDKIYKELTTRKTFWDPSSMIDIKQENKIEFRSDARGNGSETYTELTIEKEELESFLEKLRTFKNIKD